MSMKGFTLLEMAVVLLVLGILLSASLPLLSAQQEMQRRQETRRQLNDIQDAVLGFTVSRGRLPCPASGSGNTGLEAVTGSGVAAVCSLSQGVLPWATLGVGESDAWGRRFSYRVSASFADGADGTGENCALSPGVSFQLCSTANLTLLTNGGNKLATEIPAVIVSHGPNGAGGYTLVGTQLSGGSADEQENADNDNTFVAREPGNDFDDLVQWLSPHVLLNRMVAAGKLP